MFFRLRGIILVFIPIFLVACKDTSHQDVKDFIAKGKLRPPVKIKPLPTYKPYQPHTYDSSSLRSPFELPVLVKRKAITANTNVRPDINRQKQRLEGFELSSLSMVGSIKKGGVLWALIRDPDGIIEGVRAGYYLGRNNGRITELTEEKIDLVEIVASSVDGWFERPNIITMKEQ